jgi:hypothetical protein
MYQFYELYERVASKRFSFFDSTAGHEKKPACHPSLTRTETLSPNLVAQVFSEKASTIKQSICIEDYPPNPLSMSERIFWFLASKKFSVKSCKTKYSTNEEAANLHGISHNWALGRMGQRLRCFLPFGPQTHCQKQRAQLMDT